MAKIINGKEISAQIREEIKAEVAEMTAAGNRPGLAVILVGDDPASAVYVRNKKKACEDTGIYSRTYELPAETTEEELLALVKELLVKTCFLESVDIVDYPLYDCVAFLAFGGYL